MINVEIARTANENGQGIIRKFTKRVQGSGILNRLRGERYHTRTPSTYTKKKAALKKLARRKVVDRLIKLGKMVEKKRR